MSFPLTVILSITVHELFSQHVKTKTSEHIIMTEANVYLFKKKHKKSEFF